MKKILISAFACRPGYGSEDMVGWNWIMQASKCCEVHVVTKEEYKEDIEKKDISNVVFYYCASNTKWHDISIYYEYFRWQIKSYKLIREICKIEKYDYIWSLTFGNMILPTFLYKIDVPLIWGPVSGVDKIPSEFYSKFSFKEKFPLQMIRNIVIDSLRINMIFNLMVKKADKIIVRTPNTYNYIPKKYLHKTQIHLETAFDIFEIEQFEFLDEQIYLEKEVINFTYTGQLVARKNIAFLLRAFAKLYKKNRHIKLNIVGEGKLKARLIELSKELGIENVVEFWGSCTREKTLQILSESDCYVFPSLIDTLAVSVLEAMALKKPIICLDVSGMNIAMREEFAFKIPITTYEQCLHDFSEAMNVMIQNGELFRKERGQRAYDYMIKHYNWNEIGMFIHTLLN